MIYSKLYLQFQIQARSGTAAADALMLVTVNCRALRLQSWWGNCSGTFVKHPAYLFVKRTSVPVRVIALARLSASASKTNHVQRLNSEQRFEIHSYINSLLQWNQRMNLTAMEEENEVMERHVEDSLAMIEPIRSSYLSHCGNSLYNMRVIDVGSGAGLPGIILAIACPDWNVTLLESMNKRCVFLEHVVDSIGLRNVQVIRERAENLGQNPDFRESFDVAIARAVAEMRVLAEYCLPLVRVGGLFFAAKGHDPQEEV